MLAGLRFLEAEQVAPTRDIDVQSKIINHIHGVPTYRVIKVYVEQSRVNSFIEKLKFERQIARLLVTVTETTPEKMKVEVINKLKQNLDYPFRSKGSFEADLQNIISYLGNSGPVIALTNFSQLSEAEKLDVNTNFLQIIYNTYAKGDGGMQKKSMIIVFDTKQ